MPNSDISLQVKIGDIQLRNPIILSPGPCGRSPAAMKIAHLDFGDRPIFLAPMEDVSDPPFRILCKRFGADMVYTEFISSGGLVYGADGSHQKLDIYESERPVGIQIWDHILDAQAQEAAFKALVDMTEYGFPSITAEPAVMDAAEPDSAANRAQTH